MKTTMKNFAMMMLTVIALASCQDDPTPAVERLTDINVQEGNYAISYDGDGDVSLVQYFEGVDVTTYSFTWSADNHKLTMLTTQGTNDVTVNTFEYLDVVIDGKPETVLHKIVFDDDKLVQVNYIAAPGEHDLTIVESFTYNLNGGGDMGDATWSMNSNQLILDYSTNNETVEINFNNSIDAWWTKLPAEISAVLFENEFDYPYFLSTKEVASIVNTYDAKETSDYNNIFNYQYSGDRIAKIGMNGNSATFIWK